MCATALASFTDRRGASKTSDMKISGAIEMIENLLVGLVTLEERVKGNASGYDGIRLVTIEA